MSFLFFFQEVYEIPMKIKDKNIYIYIYILLSIICYMIYLTQQKINEKKTHISSWEIPMNQKITFVLSLISGCNDMYIYARFFPLPLVYISFAQKHVEDILDSRICVDFIGQLCKW